MMDYKIYDDRKLIQLMRSGDDERILVEIYDRYWKKMLAVAYNRLGSLEEAEECVQDVLYKLWKLRGNLSLEKNELANYLARAIRNHAFNALEQRRRRRLKLSEYDLEGAIDELSPERQLIVQELQQQIDKAVKNLPPQCQLVFMLNKNEGLSTKQIANTLNLSENTVKSHLKKAKKDLGNNMELLTTLMFIQIYLQQF